MLNGEIKNIYVNALGMVSPINLFSERNQYFKYFKTAEFESPITKRYKHLFVNDPII